MDRESNMSPHPQRIVVTDDEPVGPPIRTATETPLRWMALLIALAGVTATGVVWMVIRAGWPCP